MKLFLDIIIIAVLGISIFLGLRGGFVKTLIRLIGAVLAIVLAFSFSAPIGNFIGQHYIKPQLREYIAGQVAKSAGVDSKKSADEIFGMIDIDKSLKEPAEGLSGALRTFGIKSTEELIGKFNKDKNILNPVQYADKIIDSVISPISNSIGKAIAFILIFIIVNIAFTFFKFLFGFVNKIPFLKQINKIGGLILGTINGIILVLIIVFVFKLTIPIIDNPKKDALNEETIQHTVMFKVFYNSLK